MKVIAWALLILTWIVPLQADILANSDFADGPAHWQGDAEAITTPESLADPSAAPPGVVISLKPDRWTKIYQTFTAPVDFLKYTIILKLSPDYSADLLKDTPASQPHLPAPPGLTDLPGYTCATIANGITGDSMAAVFVTEPNSTGIYPIQLDLNKSGSQTFSDTIGGDFSEGKASIVVAFPPGRGSVILTTVSLNNRR